MDSCASVYMCMHGFACISMYNCVCVTGCMKSKEQNLAVLANLVQWK